jgi:hypothetical protein
VQAERDLKKVVVGIVLSIIVASLVGFGWTLGVYYLARNMSEKILQNYYIFFLFSVCGFYGEIVAVSFVSWLTFRLSAKNSSIYYTLISTPVAQGLTIFWVTLFFFALENVWFWPTLAFQEINKDIPFICSLAFVIALIFAFFTSPRAESFFSDFASRFTKEEEEKKAPAE